MPDKNNSNKDNNRYYYMSLVIPFGLMVGTILGLRFNNVGIGSGLGIVFGMFVGFLIDYNKNDIKKMYLIKIIIKVVITVIGMTLISLTPKMISWIYSQISCLL